MSFQHSTKGIYSMNNPDKLLLVRPRTAELHQWSVFASALCEVLNATKAREPTPDDPDADDGTDFQPVPAKPKKGFTTDMLVTASRGVVNLGTMKANELEKLYAETVETLERIRKALSVHKVRPHLKIHSDRLGTLDLRGMTRPVLFDEDDTDD